MLSGFICISNYASNYWMKHHCNVVTQNKTIIINSVEWKRISARFAFLHTFMMPTHSSQALFWASSSWNTYRKWRGWERKRKSAAKPQQLWSNSLICVCKMLHWDINSKEFLTLTSPCLHSMGSLRDCSICTMQCSNWDGWNTHTHSYKLHTIIKFCVHYFQLWSSDLKKKIKNWKHKSIWPVMWFPHYLQSSLLFLEVSWHLNKNNNYI